MSSFARVEHGLPLRQRIAAHAGAAPYVTHGAINIILQQSEGKRVLDKTVKPITSFSVRCGAGLRTGRGEIETDSPKERLMRLKKRECNEEEFFDEVFSAADDLALAMNAGDFPYVIPVNFAQERANGARRIYIHCAPEGRKLDLLRADGRVAFMLHAGVEIDREHATTIYTCLCGTGRAVIVENAEEKGHALDAIAARYQARCHVPARPGDIARVAILRIDVESLSGKRRPRG